jgi:hypothetical protein
MQEVIVNRVPSKILVNDEESRAFLKEMEEGPQTSYPAYMANPNPEKSMIMMLKSGKQCIIADYIDVNCVRWFIPAQRAGSLPTPIYEHWIKAPHSADEMLREHPTGIVIGRL